LPDDFSAAASRTRRLRAPPLIQGATEIGRPGLKSGGRLPGRWMPKRGREPAGELAAGGIDDLLMIN